MNNVVKDVFPDLNYKFLKVNAELFRKAYNKNDLDIMEMDMRTKGSQIRMRKEKIQELEVKFKMIQIQIQNEKDAIEKAERELSSLSQQHDKVTDYGMITANL
jgi:hypothetical protein